MLRSCGSGILRGCAPLCLASFTLAASELSCALATGEEGGLLTFGKAGGTLSADELRCALAACGVVLSA
eukprot:NODE_10299_length_311_cov_1.015625.p3 GENE.NODE_10299_length_311_cov_1.015625~~NODE_10299_length_311_cov_1.015625.p3  ORF type:complete len:76 (+),score=19.44 NODE_10299_length_311_cov_1.015625:24-230(+)